MIKRVFLLLLLTFITFCADAQKAKLDRMITKSYQVIDCTVSKVTETTIEYTFPNEKMVNEISTEKVARIEFATGRVQEFNTNNNTGNTQAQGTAGNAEVATISIKKNTIAVLPVPFVNSETMGTSAEMAKFAQNDVYSKLIAKASNINPLTVQDVRETNSLLKKAGIDYTNIDETPIAQLQQVLGVDHVIAAKVSYTVALNKTTTGYSSTNVNVKDKKTSVDDFSSSSSTEEKKFYFKLFFDIYKENNKIYSNSRTPFFNFKDSWVDGMTYLLKRSPIFNK